MSDPYLLAAMLTGGQMAAPPPPTILPEFQPDTLLALLDSAEEHSTQSIAIEIAPTVEISPEFSQRQLASIPLLTATAAPSAPELLPDNTFLKPRSAVSSPTSGSQLYIQRLAALRAGKLYTRIPADSFKSAWTKATQQPSYEQWKYLLAQEAKAVARGQGSNRLSVLVGDSLSLWFPSRRLPDGQLWLNQGISGDTSAGILRRLSAFSRTRPDTIYVLAGINDLRRGATDQAILDNIRLIARRLRLNHPQAQIILQSILPTRIPTIPNSRIRNLNQQIAVIAQQEGAEYLDIHSRFSDGEGNMPLDLTTDGLHLNINGYEVWQSALQQADFQIAQNRQALAQKGLRRVAQ